MSNLDQAELRQCFDAVRSGDRKAFAALYQELKIPVYSVIRRIVRTQPAAEDAMQEVFLKLLAEPPAPSVQNLRAWVFRMARNQALDALKKKQHAELTEDVPSGLPPMEQEIATRLDLEDALGRLDVAERELLVLHLTAGLTFREVAEITGSFLPSVYRQYRKALGRLRDFLNGGSQ